ncbi:MAG TPA: diguanylate cyclase, partial [Gemmatimonadales bacterium]|nr:diguanylate cyclase [Gemmatimonadales bacterium]
MNSWSGIGDRALRALHLNSMSGKFLVFAVVATLFTAVVMSVALPRESQQPAGDLVAVDLQRVSSEAAREMGVWLDQRVFDLRLRASPYVVSDNLARATGRTGAQAVGRLRDYLNSLRQNLSGHDGLAILALDGQMLTNSGSRTGFRLSPDQLNNLRTHDVLVGDAYWDPGVNKPVIILVVPIRRDDGLFLGALSAKVNLSGLIDVVREHAADGHRVYAVTEQGRVVISSAGNSADVMKTTLPTVAMRELMEQEGKTVGQSRTQGREVLATLRRVPQLRWATVAEAPVTDEGGQGGRATLLILALVIVVGLLAFLASILITRPVVRLSEAAARIAAGDLSVDLPPMSSGGEVGYLARALNTVVTRLREKEGQSELEKLSLTDALTGLYNRRHLMGTLASEVQRSRRLRRAFTVLLADVDKFKQYNDTHGHLAGDTALVKIAEVFRRMTRAVDCVARYGGEEFVVMLLECPIATAPIVAERIRARIAETELGQGRLTVSIGLAEYPDG